MSAAQEEFNELMRNKEKRRQHPEDDDDARSFLNLSDEDEDATPEASQADSDEAPPRPSMSSRHTIPLTRYQANTGPKGVIADAQHFRDSRRQHRVSVRTTSTVTSQMQNKMSLYDQRTNEKRRDSDEDEEEEEDVLDDDFMKQWRSSRLREMQTGGRDSKMHSRRPSKRMWGSLVAVDGEGYLDAVDKSPPDAVVIVYIYDDASEVSSEIERCLRQLARRHVDTRFVKLHYVDAEMERAGVPALLAYRGGDKFAGLVPIVDEIPDDAELSDNTLENLLRRLAGAIAVTIPSCWYLWPTAHADSGHHDAHGEHEEHEEGEGEGTLGGEDNSDGDSIVPKSVAEALPEGVEKAVPDSVHNTSGEGSDNDEEGGKDNSGGDSVVPKPVAEALPEGAEKAVPDAVHNTSSDSDEGSADSKPSGSDSSKSRPGANSTEERQSAKATDKASGSQGEGQDAGSVTPSDHAEKKEGGGSGVGKGNMRSDSAGASGNETRKSEPDNKGGSKTRVDSGLQKDLGGTQQQFDENGSETAATSKTPVKGDSGQISSKQFGMSNSPTRHSTQIDEDPEKSKKSEGGPDTAKVMGTVDPNRPAT
ncbi:hypothetical protein LTR10_001148 [Elasticomyces elasticus]|nr:hypothetical protein LTR10_001148 [Elasticomyces elasticus]KAK4965486.1 hypothetical protein LTR42_012242 [Elasticomyces elasticus]